MCGREEAIDAAARASTHVLEENQVGVPIAVHVAGPGVHEANPVAGKPQGVDQAPAVRPSNAPPDYETFKRWATCQACALPRDHQLSRHVTHRSDVPCVDDLGIAGDELKKRRSPGRRSRDQSCRLRSRAPLARDVVRTLAQQALLNDPLLHARRLVLVPLHDDVAPAVRETRGRAFKADGRRHSLSCQPCFPTARQTGRALGAVPPEAPWPPHARVARERQRAHEGTELLRTRCTAWERRHS